MDIVSPFLRVGLEYLLDRPDGAGVVDQDIDPVELGECSFHHLFDLIGIGDIAWNGDGLCAST